MSFIISDAEVKSLQYNAKKGKKMLIGSTKVWSGATLVSYYDGTTLLGRLEYDEGLDVLHPPISTKKNGYTLIGWAKTNRGQKVTSLKAAGDSMSVYAIYLPNILTILRATMGYGAYPSYTVDYYDSDYMTEPVHAVATGWYHNLYSSEDTQYLYIPIGDYREMTVNGVAAAWGDNVIATIDDNNCLVEGGITLTYNTSRTIKMYARGSHPDRDSWHVVRCGLTSVELSNPKPWV